MISLDCFFERGQDYAHSFLNKVGCDRSHWSWVGERLRGVVVRDIRPLESTSDGRPSSTQYPGLTQRLIPYTQLCYPLPHYPATDTHYPIMLPDTRLPMADPATDTHDPIMLPDTRLLMADPATDTQYPHKCYPQGQHKPYGINPMPVTCDPCWNPTSNTPAHISRSLWYAP